MTSEHQHNAVSSADIQSLGEKLEQFRLGLPPGEQAVLSWLIQRAALNAEDAGIAQGYSIVFVPQPDDPERGALPFKFEATWNLSGSQA